MVYPLFKVVKGIKKFVTFVTMKQLKFIGQNPNRLVMALLGLWTIINLVQAAFTGLANDEVYYWYISRTLDFGYFDHPPLFALFTRLGVSIGGDGSLWIRLGAVLAQPIYLYILWMMVRTSRSGLNSALTFVLVCFSMPLLQAFGFIDTPDAPLMLFTALVLWSYQRYCQTAETGIKNWFTGGWQSLGVAILCLGLSVGGMAYAKYHGALVVILIVLSNVKMMRRPSFWAACALAVAVMVPHLWWQWSHDWVSFHYHLSGRNSLFSWGPVGEYILNLLAIFNPMLVVFFVGYMMRSKNTADPLERAFKFLVWGFVLFFGISTFKGQVQAQWLIPLVFPVVYFLCRGAEGRKAAARYFRRVGLVMVGLFMALRIAIMVYDGDRINIDILVNEKYSKQLYKDLGGMPLIPDSYYATASKYVYYNGGESYAMPSIYLRSSQFEFEDGDTELHGRPVAIAISPKVLDSLTLDQAKERFLWCKPSNGFEFIYDTVGFYIPTRKVEVTPEKPLPTKMISGQRVPVTIILRNPYEFDIPMQGIDLIAQLRFQRLTHFDIKMPVPSIIKTLPAGQSVRFKSEFTLPEDIPTRKYMLGFSLQRYPFGSWYNSKRVEVQVVNPDNRGI